MRFRKLTKEVAYGATALVATQDDASQLINENKSAIAIVGHSKLAKWAVFLCPCGCGDTLRVSLQRSIPPAWRIRLTRDNRVTLSPSVWRESACMSHFVLSKSIAYLFVELKARKRSKSRWLGSDP